MFSRRWIVATKNSDILNENTNLTSNKWMVGERWSREKQEEGEEGEMCFEDDGDDDDDAFINKCRRRFLSMHTANF